jgi:hypothetical protein
VTDLDAPEKGRKALFVRLLPTEHAALAEAAVEAGTSLQALARARLLCAGEDSAELAVQLDAAASASAHTRRSSAAKKLAAENVGRPSKRKGRKFPKPAP